MSSQPAASQPPRVYSRADLDALRQMSCRDNFAALRSFDHAGMDDDAFTLAAAELLDPRRVPGLASLRSTRDTAGLLAAVRDACLRHFPDREPAPPAADADAARQVALAREVLAHRFTFYDEPHTLPADIDWDHNPGTAHWGHDLNRFTYLRTLVDAWRTTGERPFARKAVDLMLDWNTKCPWHAMFVGTPYVFGSYLNEAAHIHVWASTIRTLLPAHIVTPLELLRLLKSLHDQVTYLQIVTNGHAGNWPTIGCMGMLGTMCTIGILRDTDHVADYCVDTLAQQIDAQVLPDGVQDELTPHYHRVVISNLLSASESLRLLGRTLKAPTLATLGRMIHYAEQMRTPDGSSLVAFNDSDPQASTDLSARLAKLGLQHMIVAPEQLKAEHYPFAGVALLRQPAMRGDLYLAFDGGPFGRSHQHEDMLGFWLFAYGRSFIVDPGRHLYDSSEKSFREHLCSTRAHSTFRIDDRDQHARGRRDTWIATEPVPLTFTQADGEIRAAAQYDLGYGKDNDVHVVHRREVVFVRERCWVLFDTIRGEGEHTCESRFQFAPHAALKVQGPCVTTQYDDANLLLWSAPATPWQRVAVEEGQTNPRSGWYSHRYGLLEPAPCLVSTTTTSLPFTVATLLWPCKGNVAADVSFTFDGVQATIRSGPDIWPIVMLS